MSEVAIKLKSNGRVYTIDSGKSDLEPGNEILIEAENCQEAASVIPNELAKEMKKEEKKESRNEEKKEEKEEIVYIRKLDENDKKRISELSKEAKTYLIECQKKIEKYNLPMELLDSEQSFDEKKLTFYFSAPNRVDFRFLVSDLAHTFKKIIRLQQIGARDKARYLGGVGRCGQVLCCRRFLKGNLESVTLNMATEQNLSTMGTNRVTGVCGKLMCCLKYELDYYSKIKKDLPPINSEIETAEGKGRVISHNVIKNSVTAKLESGAEVEVAC